MAFRSKHNHRLSVSPVNAVNETRRFAERLRPANAIDCPITIGPEERQLLRLLVAQRLDRVELRRAPRRVDAEEQADSQRETKSNRNRA